MQLPHGTGHNSAGLRPSVPASSASKPSPTPANGGISGHLCLLSMDDSTRVTVTTVTRVNAAPGVGATRGAPPPWLPQSVPRRNWTADPPCYWRVDRLDLRELEHQLLQAQHGAAQQQTDDPVANGYNPVSDCTLELVRWFRPDIFDNIFHLFRVWSKRTYSQRQLSQIRDSFRPDAALLENPDSSFSPDSPLAAALRNASLAEDFLPEIEHYLALIGVRAFRLRAQLCCDGAVDV